MHNMFVKNSTYSLKEIFSGENDKVIIPDLQRDYCWGNPYSKDREESLVDSFLDSILEVFNKSQERTTEENKDITMGLIYGYFDPLKPYHLQLCDGQQRLTTLFLIMGVINRYVNNKYKELLISDFELKDDDKEPHLLYAIRESSIYFLSDLTTHFFLNPEISSNEIENQQWFLNSYNQDATITSIIMAIKTIEKHLDNFDRKEQLGDFIQEHIKFLFYDLGSRQNGEETFVVINTTGEPLSANQNLKPRIISNNQDYRREFQNQNGTVSSHNAAQDWEEMETWFWKHRRKNGIDTSTEGMIAFLHCVRILESETESDWYHAIDINDDKFSTSITMEEIWEWFSAYQKIYDLDNTRLFSQKIEYPDQPHYTQKSLYSILPTMTFCKEKRDATDKDIQRVYHLFCNMSKYSTVNRYLQENGKLRVPAYQSCQWVKSLKTNDIISLLDISEFDVEEEKTKLKFIQQSEEVQREDIEELFAKAENLSIYEGQISTLVKWSNSSAEELKRLYGRIEELWNQPNTNKLRRALLAFGMNNDYPMRMGNNTNLTLCSGKEWRYLFEKQGDRMVSFLNDTRSLDEIIDEFDKQDSPFYKIIKEGKYLDFSRDHQIAIWPNNVVELLAKTYRSADYLLFHNNQVFEKTIVDMSNWDGLKIWSEGDETVFYSVCKKYNITLDMRIINNGYQIIAWTNRNPKNTSVKYEILERLGFQKRVNEEEWNYPEIHDSKSAKDKFIELSKKLVE